MIVYDLVCTATHRFEAWFGSSGDYVGARFAAEARAIHGAGETRSIHGEAIPAKVKALREDGISLLPLPFRPRARSDA